MRRLRRGWSRLRGAFGGRRRERELAEEFESHIRMQTEDNLRLGMPPEAARCAAALKFGNVESAKEAVQSGTRETRGERTQSWVKGRAVVFCLLSAHYGLEDK